jgi:hypothetical protein
MKKRLLAAAILASLTLSTAIAFAAPEISGDAQLLTQKNDGGSTYTDVRLRLNADADLGDGIYAHGRIMGIDESIRNYDRAGTGSKGANVNMEQLYLGAKVGATDLKVGRQPLFIGNGMLADVNGIQGVSLGTSAGDINALGFIGRSDEPAGPRDTVAFNLGTKVEDVNLGVGYMTTNDAQENKYLSFNADTKLTDKVVLSADYVKNTEAEADGYLVKATFGQVAKKGDFNYALSYRNIEDGAVDGDWVTNGAYADSKGFRVAANYKVTDNATLSVYQDITKKNSDSSEKPNQARLELNVNF